MMLLISIFSQIYLRRYVLGNTQEHWLLNASQSWEQINECMIFIVWDGDVIRLNEQCWWLVYLFEYTWEGMYLGQKEHWQLNASQYWEQINECMTNFHKTDSLSDLINDFVYYFFVKIYLRRYVLKWAQEHWLLNVSQYWDRIIECMIFYWMR